MIHRLKIKEEYAEAVYRGAKHFEVCRNDRNYQIGDIIVFTALVDESSEWGHPIDYMAFMVTYVLTAEDFPDGIKEDYCVFTIAPMEEQIGRYYQNLEN